MSLKNKLNRLKPHLSTNSSNKPVPVKENFGELDRIPYIDKWNEANVTPYFVEGEYCLVREKRFPLNYQHGNYRFLDFLEVVNAWNETNITHPLSAKGFGPEQLFFFDTETTGLGGGTGNTIFLLGYASFFKTEVVLKQYILPQPGAEIPLYQCFLSDVDYSTLVTYNGKAFDWPVVKTRHTLIREHVPKLPAFGHFDLFHAARRMWKHRLERLKLSIVEEEILGVERIDDIPGYLAPMIYFDFVERKDPEGMLGIIKHNETDILSLISLYTHLSFQLLGQLEKQTKREKFEVGRWYSALGEVVAAKEMLQQAANGNDLDAVKAKLTLAYQFKREKQWNEARFMWDEVVENGSDLLKQEAAIELAKYYEHHEKDYLKALKYSILSKEIHEKQIVLNPVKHDKLCFEIVKRMDRLNRKINFSDK